MLTLAIETATERSSAVLVERGVEMAGWRSRQNRNLCRELAPAITALFQESGRSFDDLELICVGLGPGSFTALRIGLATAKGIALARGVPLVGVSSLAAMVWQNREATPELLCPVIDARRGELYAALFRAKENVAQQIDGEWVLPPARLAERLLQDSEPVAVFGSISSTAQTEQVRAVFSGAQFVMMEPMFPDAIAVAKLGCDRFGKSGADTPASLRPIYVRMSYAEERFDIDLGLR